MAESALSAGAGGSTTLQSSVVSSDQSPVVVAPLMTWAHENSLVAPQTILVSFVVLPVSAALYATQL